MSLTVLNFYNKQNILLKLNEIENKLIWLESIEWYKIILFLVQLHGYANFDNLGGIS